MKCEIRTSFGLSSKGEIVQVRPSGELEEVVGGKSQGVPSVEMSSVRVAQSRGVGGQRGRVGWTTGPAATCKTDPGPRNLPHTLSHPNRCHQAQPAASFWSGDALWTRLPPSATLSSCSRGHRGQSLSSAMAPTGQSRSGDTSHATTGLAASNFQHYLHPVPYGYDVKPGRPTPNEARSPLVWVSGWDHDLLTTPKS